MFLQPTPKEDMLAWVILYHGPFKGLFLAPKQPFKYQYRVRTIPFGLAQVMAFHARMRAHWQRLKRHRSAMTLISTSQCTHWCIDGCADQLEELFFWGTNWTNFVESPSQRPYPPEFSQLKASFCFFFREPFSLVVFLIPPEMLSATVVNVLRELRRQPLSLCWGGVSILLCVPPSWNPAELKRLIDKNVIQTWRTFLLPSQSIAPEERL